MDVGHMLHSWSNHCSPLVGGDSIVFFFVFFKTDQSLKMALTMKLISGRIGVEKYTEIIPKCPI